MPILSTLIAENILLGPTQFMNLVAAVGVLTIGIFLYAKDRRSDVHKLILLISLSLSFWALSSTLSDIMHEPLPAETWARLSILGPYWFSALFHIFSYYFPQPGRHLPWWKALIILAPSIAIIPLIGSPLNIVSTSLEDWGTNYVPGELYLVGTLYLLLNVVFAGVNFARSRRGTVDPIIRKQVALMFFSMALVICSLLLTNAILPIVFQYAQASVFGPASSLFFVILVGYAVVRHGFLDSKVIATELFTVLLIYVSIAQIFQATGSLDALLRGCMLVATVVFGMLLVRSVNREVRRRRELQVLSVKLKAANKDLKELNAAKTEFLNIATHELRTPLTVIKGYLSLLQEGAYGVLPDQARIRAVHMMQMNQRMIFLINNLLNASRIEKKRIEYLLAPVSPTAVVSSIKDDMMFKSEQVGVALSVDMPPSLPEVVADADKLIEVLANLLDNAFKYTKKGGKVTLSAFHDQALGIVKFTVTDTGIGFTKEQSAKLFSRYYRVRTRETEGIPGTGIGLFISKTFAEGMGGKLKLESSKPGVGSTFALTLPVSKK